MKRVILAAVAVIVITICGCAEVTEEHPIDARYTPSYTGIETEYEYRFDAWNGEMKLFPVVKTVYHEEKYEIEYEQILTDGKKRTRWQEVTKEEYEGYIETKSTGGEHNE